MNRKEKLVAIQAELCSLSSHIKCLEGHISNSNNNSSNANTYYHACLIRALKCLALSIAHMNDLEPNKTHTEWNPTNADSDAEYAVEYVE